MRTLVAPYVGAWIETYKQKKRNEHQVVAPYVGAWIETAISASAEALRASHPTWVRGLKHQSKTLNNQHRCRTLRGCVD